MTFHSLDEAWVELMEKQNHDPGEMILMLMRTCFYAGAMATFELMLSGGVVEVHRDLSGHVAAIAEQK